MGVPEMLKESSQLVSDLLDTNASKQQIDEVEVRALQHRRPPTSDTQLTSIINRAEVFARSGFFKDALQVAQAAVKLMIGESLGFSDVASLGSIYLFDNKGRTVITISAHLLGALVQSSTRYRFKAVEFTAKRCELAFYEKGFMDDPGWVHVGSSVFTIEEAAQASLLGKDNWKSYPQDMLWARALARGFRRYAQVLMAIVPYVPEEFQDTDYKLVGEATATPKIAVAQPQRVSKKVDKAWPEARRVEWLKVHDGTGVNCANAGCEACRWDAWEAAAEADVLLPPPVAETVDQPVEGSDANPSDSSNNVMEAEVVGAEQPEQEPELPEPPLDQPPPPATPKTCQIHGPIDGLFCEGCQAASEKKTSSKRHAK